MDFVRAGDRLLDVGYGRGYLASLLIRDVGVESYHGIDILDDWRAMSLATLAANDLADAPVQIGYGGGSFGSVRHPGRLPAVTTG